MSALDDLRAVVADLTPAPPAGGSVASEYDEWGRLITHEPAAGPTGPDRQSGACDGVALPDHPPSIGPQVEAPTVVPVRSLAQPSACPTRSAPAPDGDRTGGGDSGVPPFRLTAPFPPSQAATSTSSTAPAPRTGDVVAWRTSRFAQQVGVIDNVARDGRLFARLLAKPRVLVPVDPADVVARITTAHLDDLLDLDQRVIR